MRTVYLVIGLMLSQLTFSQAVKEKLATALNMLGEDSQFKHASISMYVIDSKTGAVVYEKNPEMGLAPASTQKIITSASAFEILGKEYQYKTHIGGDLAIIKSTLNGNLHFLGSGDPTLGSWRWTATKEENILKKVLQILKDNDIKKITGGIYIDDLKYSYSPIPDGWVWQDIGNYYGAGAWALNWHENQYDLHLRSTDAVGESTMIISTSPVDLAGKIDNYITSGIKGSGDNAYLYATPYDENIFATGTIPVGEKDFVISGSIPNPPEEFANKILSLLNTNKISIKNNTNYYRQNWMNAVSVPKPTAVYGTIISPPLDSINYWFLKKSVNLYGEAFVKTIAVEKRKEGSTSNGIEIIRDFWNKNGIERSALNIIDGSGLSPANRITTKSLVQVLEYAKDKKWYTSFYNALPEMNGIKMKDGYIGGVRSYTGYVKSRSGQEFTFAFIVNNFDGSAAAVREKMYKVLDLLK